MNTLQLFSTTTKTPSAAFCPRINSYEAGLLRAKYGLPSVSITKPASGGGSGKVTATTK